MPKYKIIYHWADGEDDEDDNNGEYYDSEERAEEVGLYGLSCAELGGEILEMSNPGDYPFNKSFYDESDFEIVEVDE